MKLQRAITILLLPLLFANCQKRDLDANAAKGDVMVRIPWSDFTDTEADESTQGAAKYELDNVLLKGIKNLYAMSGQFLQTFYAPKYLQDHISGNAPTLDFIRSRDGIYIPTNELSQEAAVLYAHFQNLYDLDKSLGIENLQTWPRKLTLGSVMQVNDQKVMNNTLYDGARDIYIVLKHSGQDFPLWMNAGVNAHEHFHSHFYKLVKSELLKSKKINAIVGADSHLLQEALPSDLTAKEIYTLFLIRAWDEGLADLWGWIYSGEVDFVSTSLPSLKDARSLSAKSVQGFNMEQITKENLYKNIQNQVEVYKKNPTELNSQSYLYGTAMARQLKAIFAGQIWNKKNRIEFARKIIAALPVLKDGLLKVDDKNLADPALLFSSIRSANKLSAVENERIDNITVPRGLK